MLTINERKIVFLTASSDGNFGNCIYFLLSISLNNKENNLHSLNYYIRLGLYYIISKSVYGID